MLNQQQVNPKLTNPLMRVYELAKQLGLENRDLLPELKRMGVAVASHSSTLDESTVQKVLEKLGSKGNVPRTGTAERDEAATSADGGRGKKATKHARAAGASPESGPSGRSGKASKSAPAASVEPPKPEKRRILIKRKKTDEELAVEAGESQAAELPPDQLSPAATGSEAVTAPPLPESPTVELPSVPPSLDLAGVVQAPAVEQSPPPGASPTASATPSGTSIEPQPLPVEKRTGVSLESLLGEGAAAKDRLKKTKKVGRSREGEDTRFREDATRWQDLRAIPVHRREDRSRRSQPSSVGEVTKPRKKVFKFTAGLSVKEFAELVGQRPVDIVRRLMETGQMRTFNQPMDADVAMLIGESLGLKVEVSTEKQGEDLLEEALGPTDEEKLEARPPVVTIMGHVDHGKTSLLDAIRQTKVTEQEAGGITQHIGAYTVQVNGRSITFLDTPGHEAFTAMRARGAKVTDIVALVVAADDGVMPQTLEAVHHAAAGNVPIIVAINKIDKPGTNVDRIKHALAEHNLIPEAWGGQTIFVEVSAKQRIGLETLLEMILLQAEVLELKADPHRQAKGAVIEAKLDRGRGPVATVLVQGGTLRVGDPFVVGTTSGRVRALVSDAGIKIAEAGPSAPVEVVGLPFVPAAGDHFVVVKDERVAREIAAARLEKQRSADLAAGPPRVSLDDLYARIKEGEIKELALIIKSDVQGSAEALGDAVEKLSGPAVKLRVIHRAVGGITETDVLLASSSGAIIIGFNIRPEPKATALADQEGVDIRLYTVIYDAVADIKAAMEGLLEPTLKERSLGRAEVRQLFSIPKIGAVAGCYVLEGTMARSSAGLRVVRDHVTVYEGKLGSLRRFKDDVREVQQGYECGISVENFKDVKVGDIVEVYVYDKVAVKL